MNKFKQFVYKSLNKINKLRYGKYIFKDTFFWSKQFFFISKLLNFRESKKREEFIKSINNSIIEEVPRAQGYKKINIEKINKENTEINKSLYNLRKAFHRINWAEIEKHSKKKYLLMKRLEINSDLMNLVNFVLPIVSKYIGSMPILVDASYWHSLNDGNQVNIGSQKWHMDHEDFRQLKLYIPIDHEVNIDCGALNLIDKKLTHEIHENLNKIKDNLLRDNKINDDDLLRGTKINDDDFLKFLNKENQIIVCNQSLNDFFFVDTCNCYHHGSRSAKNKRNILQLHFTSAFSRIVPFLFRKKFNNNSSIDNVLCYYKNNLNYFETYGKF